MYSLEPTPAEISKALAERFRVIRKQSGLSQEAMAERSGVSLGSLKRFERSGKISLESLLKLMHLLGRSNEFNSILPLMENREDLEKLFTR